MGERGTAIKRKRVKGAVWGPLLLFFTRFIKTKEGEIPGESIGKRCCKLFIALLVCFMVLCSGTVRVPGKSQTLRPTHCESEK